MSKSIKIIVLLAISFMLNAAVAKFRRIPAPFLDKVDSKLVAAGDQITLRGKGFIKDLPNAHKVILRKKNSKKKLRLKAIASSTETLTIELPEKLELGDYDFFIHLKTKFFKSKKQKLAKFIKIRPHAPERPELKFQVIKDPNELVELISQNDNQELVLSLDKELTQGKNIVRSFYYQDGYKSLLSEALEIYYLPEQEFQNHLKINSETPLEIYAENYDQEKLEVSEITQKKEKALLKTYHLETPWDNLYLATNIELSPIYIKEAHVKSPEYLIIKNRSLTNYDLSSCRIDDAIKTRYDLSSHGFIAAQAELRIDGTLSLNDTGDTILAICDDKIIDSIEYTKVSADGFAI